MIEKRRVADTVEPGEKLRPAVESGKRFPRLPVRLLCQVGSQVAVATETEERCEDRGVGAIDELLRGAAVAAANRGKKTVLLIKGGDHRIISGSRTGRDATLLTPIDTALRHLETKV